MLRFLFPKQVDFLQYFDRGCDKVLEGAVLLHETVSSWKDVELKVQKIKAVEHDGDRITHETIETLNKTFITPIDREDIYALITKIDDILDLIDAAASRFVLYRIDRPTPELVTMCEQLIKPIKEIREALLLLDDMKNAKKILMHCVEVNRLENEADDLRRLAVGNLFENEKDPIRLMKLKEIYETLEEATDRCEDVANVIESVVIKNS
jgi:predicted phosphate transport protein (TIGR00153 family)